MFIEETSSPPSAILMTGHFKERDDYAVYRSRGSGSWLLTYTLAGSGVYRQPGLEMHTQPGDLLLLQPAAVQDYSVPTGGSWEFLWTHFQPRMDWLSWWNLPTTEHGLYLFPIRTPHIRKRLQLAFLKLHADASLPFSTLPAPSGVPSATSPGTEMTRTLQRELALNSLEEILLLATQETTPFESVKLDTRIQHILHVMVQNLKAQYDLHKLAQQVSLSPSRLSHLFKQETGDSLMNVLVALRLDKAARLLEFSSHTIATIAEEVGFNSAFYFSRQFHQRFGMSPSAYRQHIELPKQPPKQQDKNRQPE